jgi:DNA modification methylase
MTIVEEKEIKTVGKIPFNTIVEGDCLDVMANIADCSIDMVLCDLPYG